MFDTLITLDDLQPWERIWLDRKRKGLSQEEYAKQFKVSPRTIQNWEYGDVVKANRIKQRGLFVDTIFSKNLSQLTSSEHITIVRRRLRLSQSAVAKAVGISRYWLIQIEDGRVEVPLKLGTYLVDLYLKDQAKG